MDEKIERKLQNFFSQYKELQYKKGEMLVRAGDTPQGIFYLTQGSVKM